MGKRGSANDIDAQVGARIRLRRQSLGVSQVKLAESVGLAFQQIQKYENGSNRVAASILYRVAKVLNVPIGHFFDGLVKGAAAADTSKDTMLLEFVVGPEGMALNRAFAAIKDKRTRNDVLRLIKTLSGEAEDSDAAPPSPKPRRGRRPARVGRPELR